MSTYWPPGMVVRSRWEKSGMAKSFSLFPNPTYASTEMDLIDFQSLKERAGAIAKDFNAAKPFRYTMFEGFFKTTAAEQILERYPSIKNGKWDGTTYVDQKNKFQ